jgi:peptidoglycan/xylan/chitin deacetylase (PgdA/CDA1 family)
MEKKYHRGMGRGVQLLFVWMVCLFWGVEVVNASVGVEEEQGVKVLLYHRVGEEEKYPSTSVSVSQFEAHLELLSRLNFRVVGLEEALRRVREEGKVKEPIAVITFDDGFRSIMDSAWPLLQERGLPFTIFVNGGVHEKPGGAFMTWSMLREMGESGLMSLGSHGLRHESFLGMDEALRREMIESDVALIEERWGRKPKFFSYPYGETDEDGERLVEELGFLAGFGQHSGVVGEKSRRYFLPRFSLNYRYGGEERLSQILKTVPFYVDLLRPESRVVDVDIEKVLLRMGGGGSRASCFGKGELLDLERKGGGESWLFLEGVKGGERYRVNCTYPVGGGFYGWGGLILFVR